MRYKYDWTLLKNDFILGSWLSVAAFFRNQGLRDNSRNRLHTVGWLKEKRQYQEEINRKTREKVLETEVNIRIKQQKLSQQLQITGLKGLQNLKDQDLDATSALKMVVSGLQEERSALGLDGNKHSVFTHQVNIQQLPKTRLDEMIEKASYEELLQMIAEFKRLREQKSEKEVEK